MFINEYELYKNAFKVLYASEEFFSKKFFSVLKLFLKDPLENYFKIIQKVH